jgi:hypothetical protein
MAEPIPLPRLAAAARDEAAKRRSVYAKWVADRRMTQAMADARIAEMEAIADLLDQMAAPLPPGPLFGDATPPPGMTNRQAREAMMVLWAVVRSAGGRVEVPLNAMTAANTGVLRRREDLRGTQVVFEALVPAEVDAETPHD